MKKIVSLLLATSMTLALLTACSSGSSSTSSETSSTSSTSSSSEATTAETTTETGDNIFKWATATNPSNVCPYENYTEAIDYIQGKLYRYIPSESGETVSLVPDLAIGEPTTEDGYTWIISIDPNAKWANGEAITADTFMYSWEMALDPVLLNPAASGLAKNIITVENAYEYYTQESTGVEVAWEDVGFKKIDDYTLSVTATDLHSSLEVQQHFQMRHTGPVYEELFEAGMDAGRTSTNYGTEAEYHMSSGPYILDSWTKDTELIYVKNENYAHADEITLDGMITRIVSDEATQLQLYQNGDVDFITLGSNGYDLYSEDPATIAYSTSTVREIEFNFENPDKPYLNNLNFRKAMYYAIDRETIGKLTNYVPACYFIPTSYSTSADGTSFRDLPEAQEYIPDNYGYDPELALYYFDLALEETGVDSVSLNLIYNEAVSATRVASESIQSSLTNLFGADRFEMSITAMNNSEAVSLMRTAQNGPTNGWDLCWGGWSLTAAEYSANKKFEVYTTYDTRRFTNYPNTEIDELFALSTTAEYRMDLEKMTDVVLQMEESFLNDVDSLPVFQQVSWYRFSDRVVLPSNNKYLSFIGFANAYISIEN
ncbi:MAG: ABC transporter substrate-binding protein [Clostridia bacterium]